MNQLFGLQHRRSENSSALDCIRFAPSLHAETLNDVQIYFYINPLNNYNYGS